MTDILIMNELTGAVYQNWNFSVNKLYFETTNVVKNSVTKNTVKNWICWKKRMVRLTIAILIMNELTGANF